MCFGVNASPSGILVAAANPLHVPFAPRRRSALRDYGTTSYMARTALHQIHEPGTVVFWHTAPRFRIGTLAVPTLYCPQDRGCGRVPNALRASRGLRLTPKPRH